MNAISNNTNNNVNFTSKMQIQGFKIDKPKLNRIAQIFENKTQKHNDEFVLTNGKKGVTVYHCDNKYEDMERFYFIPKDQWKILLTKSDKLIADKLAKLHNIDNRLNREYIHGCNFVDKLIKKDKFNDPSNFEANFFDAFFAKINADRDLSLQNDRILKSFEVGMK